MYTSSLKRCRETAAILAAPHGLAPIADEALVELDFGAWDGMLRQDILRQYPEAWASWGDDPATTAPPGGEAAYAALARASGALARVVAQHRGEAVIVVAHKAVNRLLLCDLLGMMPRYYRSRLGQRPCALNCIEWHEGGPMVTLVNDVSHYATQSGNQEDDNACT